MRALGADGVGDAALEALGASLRERWLPAGERLYPAGARPAGVWAIRRGSVDLLTHERGRAAVVERFGAGSLVGDVPLLLEEPSPAEARVRVGGRYLFLPAPSLRSLLRAHRDLSQAWLRALARRLDRARERIHELLAADLEQSVARLLVHEQAGGVVALSQASIASMLGAQRTSVNRALHALGEAGIVEIGYRRVTIRDRDALAARATGSG